MKLGNLLERIFIITGIKRIVKYVSKLFGVDCGCENRKEQLNNLFTRK
jgi:hypothetical protein